MSNNSARSTDGPVAAIVVTDLTSSDCPVVEESFAGGSFIAHPGAGAPSLRDYCFVN